jgi:hypothetical protein
MTIGARVSFKVPGTSTVAYLHSTISGVMSGDDEYVEFLFEQESDALAAMLSELGIVVVPADPDVHHHVPTGGLNPPCTGG